MQLGDLGAVSSLVLSLEPKTHMSNGLEESQTLPILPLKADLASTSQTCSCQASPSGNGSPRHPGAQARYLNSSFPSPPKAYRCYLLKNLLALSSVYAHGSIWVKARLLLTPFPLASAPHYSQKNFLNYSSDQVFPKLKTAMALDNLQAPALGWQGPCSNTYKLPQLLGSHYIFPPARLHVWLSNSTPFSLTCGL